MRRGYPRVARSDRERRAPAHSGLGGGECRVRYLARIWTDGQSRATRPRHQRNTSRTDGKHAIHTVSCVYTNPDAERSPTALRREEAYAQLKHRLLLGEFPVNGRLVEERLASEIGVSRTPIREALTRLHAEGLVVRAIDGGYVPTIPDVTAIRHLYEVRIGLELQGLRRPAQNGTVHDQDHLVALRAEWLELADEVESGTGGDATDAAFVFLDEGFHLGLAEACGNPELAAVLQTVNERIRVVRVQDFLKSGRVQATVHEHLAIVDAVIDGNLLEAERRFVDHLDASLAVVEARVLAAIARMTAGGSR